MSDPARLVLDLRDPEFRRNPYPILAHVRAVDPVHQDDKGIWYITRHADVSSLNRDARLGRDLRKWMGYPFVRPYLADSALERCAEQWMFSLDPPDHTRLRQLVSKAFTPRAVDLLRGTIAAIADELLEPLAGPIDLMSAFARPFPVRVISRVLGLPIDNYAELKGWSDAIALVVEPTVRKAQKVAADAATRQISGYLLEKIEACRARPGEDLLSRMVLAEEQGDRLTEQELVSQLVLLFVAGHETTTNLIGNGLLALLRNPDQLARLRADPSLQPSAVEELLRYDGPANTNARVAHEDIHLGGKVIERGQLVLCMLGAANRDPEVFAEPERLDVARDPNPHVTFGGGIHYCLGAALARLETRVALDRILRRWSTLDLEESGVEWRDLVNIRGLAHLPVTTKP